MARFARLASVSSISTTSVQRETEECACIPSSFCYQASLLTTEMLKHAPRLLTERRGGWERDSRAHPSLQTAECGYVWSGRRFKIMLLQAVQERERKKKLVP